MTTAEAARQLKVSHGRVKQLVASGELPAVKLGRDNLIEVGALETYKQRIMGERTGPGRRPNLSKQDEAP